MIKSKQSSLLIASGLGVVALLWLATGTVTGSQESSDDKPMVKKPLEEKVSKIFKVQVRDFHATPMVNELKLQGQIEAFRSIQVKSELQGKIAKRVAEKGQSVNKGDALIELNVDHRKADLIHAKAELEAREADLEASKRLLKNKMVSPNQHKQSLAQLAQAQAMVMQLSLDLDYTKIRAAFDGVVNDIMVNEGDYVKVGDVVGNLVDDKSLLIGANVPQHMIHKIKLGQPVHATLLGGQVINGEVTYISQDADPQTRTFRVESKVSNLSDMPAFGQSASVSIEMQSEVSHRLPNALLDLSEQGDLQVKAVDENHIVHDMPVTIIRSESDGTYVTGLPEQVRLISVGQGFVKAGQKVDVELESETKE